MNQAELNKILELHKKWLNDEDGGKRADLLGADLNCADLTRADLTRADLTRADLRGACLNGACLNGADLTGADLRGADLRDANFKWADMTGAKLNGADLRDAYLRGANLTGADLRRADLRNAELTGVNLINVLYNETTAFLALQCPEKGSFIAYKKVDDIIIELEVPADAKRSSATTRKCRCSKAKVLGFYDLDRNELNMEEVINRNYFNFKYSEIVYCKGEMTYPDSWDEDRWNECSHGIHFFMTFEEAKNY